MRTWIEERAQKPSASTDCPVVEIDPFANLYTMITRKTASGTVLGADQALSLEEALHAIYTMRAPMPPARRRSRAASSPASLPISPCSTVISSPCRRKNPYGACDITILDGRIVYRREEAAG